MDVLKYLFALKIPCYSKGVVNSQTFLPFQRIWGSISQVSVS